MGISPRTENIQNFAVKVLNQLEIKEPTKKQIAVLASLLTGIGMVFSEISFARDLTTQETICLFWTARGKNKKQIAQLLSVSEATIKTYLQRIKKKLNCSSMEQAVFEGIRYCYIQPKSNRK